MNKDENLCQIAPMTAKGYKIVDKMTKIQIPASPTGIYSITIRIALNFEDLQMIINGQNMREIILNGVIPATKLE